MAPISCAWSFQPWPPFRGPLPFYHSPSRAGLRIGVPHPLHQAPGGDIAAIAVDDAAQVVEDTGNANMAEVDMPVVVGMIRLGCVGLA